VLPCISHETLPKPQNKRHPAASTLNFRSIPHHSVVAWMAQPLLHTKQITALCRALSICYSGRASAVIPVFANPKLTTFWGLPKPGHAKEALAAAGWPPLHFPRVRHSTSPQSNKTSSNTSTFIPSARPVFAFPSFLLPPRQPTSLLNSAFGSNRFLKISFY
jgi:hypothetical protein